MESTRERCHSKVKMQLHVYRLERLWLTKTTMKIILILINSYCTGFIMYLVNKSFILTWIFFFVIGIAFLQFEWHFCSIVCLLMCKKPTEGLILGRFFLFWGVFVSILVYFSIFWGRF